ncbi:MAG TPA: Rieske 2Fe-2S domain-containing protein [Acidimicrobiia bacterium]|nr:Rieske 2Fe-2S domain-containing protein [Acidimicrobiia bacterium]
MSTGQIAILAFAAVGLIGALAVASVALRRGTGSGTVTGSVDRRAMRRDGKRRRGEKPLAPDLPAAVLAEAPTPVDPLTLRQEVAPEEFGVTRRQFFNRGVAGIFGLFLAQMGIFTLGFMWPRIKAGGFGSKVAAGKAEELAAQVFLPDGRVSPLFIPAAQAYIIPFQGELAGSSFEGLPVVAGGLMALWQRCVHLGCRVPQCDSSQGFECPCHSSKYNFHGEYEDGPAPRNLDRFVVTIDDSGQFIIDTGQVIQTSRASQKTAAYPQGPSCI